MFESIVVLIWDGGLMKWELKTVVAKKILGMT